MIASSECGDLFAALAAAKSEIQPVGKSKENFFGGKYMELDSIKEVVDPVLEKHDLVITQWPDQTANGEPGLTTHVFHRESHQYAYATASLVLSKKDPQAQGSAITYLKRYAYVAILGIKGVEIDDDANRASLPDNQITARGEKVQAGKVSRASVGQRGELEAAMIAAGMSKVQGTKWYFNEFGKDYKTDTDDSNLAAAIVKLGMMSNAD